MVEPFFQGKLQTYTAVGSIGVLAVEVAIAGLCRGEESKETSGERDNADHFELLCEVLMV